MTQLTVRALLIDDDEGDYQITSRHLKRVAVCNYEINWVSTYQDALEALQANEHDICLMDHHLGPKTGLQLIKTIKSVSEVASIPPVILLTGQGSLDVDRQAMDMGVMDYLLKEELTPDLLERAIRYAINRKTVEQRLYRSNQELARFASIASHDLQEPLRKVQSFGSLLVKESEGTLSEAGQDYVQRMMSATERMQSLIEAILSYSRVHSQAIPFESVDLNKVAPKCN